MAREVREEGGGQIAKGLVKLCYWMMVGQVGLKEFMQKNDTMGFEKNSSTSTVWRLVCTVYKQKQGTG